MSKAGLAGFALALGIVAFVLAGSFDAGAHRCEVCMQFRGRTQCRTVEAATVDLARQGAVQNACATIAGGVTDGMACHREKPLSEKCE